MCWAYTCAPWTITTIGTLSKSTVLGLFVIATRIILTSLSDTHTRTHFGTSQEVRARSFRHRAACRPPQGRCSLFQQAELLRGEAVQPGMAFDTHWHWAGGVTSCHQPGCEQERCVTSEPRRVARERVFPVRALPHPPAAKMEGPRLSAAPGGTSSRRGEAERILRRQRVEVWGFICYDDANLCPPT